MRRTIACLLLTTMTWALSANAATPASDADRSRELADRIEIEDLMWRYCRGLDTLNEDAYADVCTTEPTAPVRVDGKWLIKTRNISPEG